MRDDKEGRNFGGVNVEITNENNCEYKKEE